MTTIRRVLHVTDSFRPNIGGLERYVEILSRRLARNGLEVVVATMEYPGAPNSEVVDGYRIIRLPALSRHLRRFAQDPGRYYHPTIPDPVLVRHLNRLSANFQPDVIHSHGWILESCVAIARPKTTALVATQHEYGIACAKKTYTQTPTGCPSGPQLWTCIRCASVPYGLGKSALLSTGLRVMRPWHGRVDRWIAISRAVAEATAVATAGAAKVDVIPTFVDDDIVALSRTELSLEVPASPFMLFVGAMGPHKGLDVLLQAREMMNPAAPLMVIGTPRLDSPDVARPGVTVHTNVAHPQVMAAWAAASVGVVPSVWPEPFGQVAVECLAAGTPVIATATGGLGDIVRDGTDGLLVPPGDPEALARALDRVMWEPGLRERLGAAGTESARRFEISTVYPEIIRAYQRALSNRLRQISPS